MADGTVVYLSINHGSTTNADFNVVAGSTTVNGNKGYFALTAVNDTSVESTETFTISARTNSSTGTVVATTGTLSIVNTTLPTATYSITSDSTNINGVGTAFYNEGETATFVVTSTNVANGTALKWKIVNTTTSSNDLSAQGGDFTINGNVGSFTIRANSDSLSETTEYFKVQITRADGTVLATSGDVGVINVTPPTQAPTAAPTPAPTAAPTPAPTEPPTTSPVPVITNFTAFCFYGENVSSEWGGSFVTDTPGITYYFTLNLYEGNVTRIYETVTPDSSGLCKVSFFTGDNTVHWSMYPIAAVRTGSRDGPILAKAPILYEGREAFPMPPDLFDAI